MNPKYLASLLIGALALPAANLPAAPLVVHEWGTFTSLQNENGQAIGGINTDDEPVPPFVHRVQDFLLLKLTEIPSIWSKSLPPRCFPDVTMRLETPVLYFHPSASQTNLRDINVTAKFNGGWLTEFYPNAAVVAPGIKSNSFAFGPLTSGTVGTLSWTNLEIGGNWSGPETSEHVWTAPRAVQSANIHSPSPADEAEKFLFYRGVGHIDAPLAVSQNPDARELTLRSQLPPDLATGSGLKVKSLWLADIRANGQIAFRPISPINISGTGKTLATIPGSFSPGDYHAENLRALKVSLSSALMAEGLNPDEAMALLDTWELSYFKSTGLRLFFLVPRAWTEHYLPLEISTPADITRVIVGRIELITPAQRDNLRQIARLSPEKITADQLHFSRDFTAWLTNRPAGAPLVFPAHPETLAAFGLKPPRSYQLYLDLGRFRNALILDEARQHPAPGLEHFITNYRLQPYQPVSLSAANSINQSADSVTQSAH